MASRYHEAIFNAIVVQVTSRSTPLNYHPLPYQFKHITDFSSLPRQQREDILNGWAFEDEEELQEYLEEPAESVEALILELSILQEFYRTGFLCSKEMRDLSTWISSARGTAGNVVQATEGMTLDVLASSWRRNIAPALIGDLCDMLDDYVRTIDALVWVALRRSYTAKARMAVLSHREVYIRSTVEALNMELGLNTSTL
jgi:hypothetical protein